MDAANVLPPDVEASLTTKLEALQQTQKRQLVVVTAVDDAFRRVEELLRVQLAG